MKLLNVQRDNYDPYSPPRKLSLRGIPLTIETLKRYFILPDTETSTKHRKSRNEKNIFSVTEDRNLSVPRQMLNINTRQIAVLTIDLVREKRGQP